jgi:hypothetical protein
MKIAARILSLLILAGVSMLYVGCGPEDSDDKTERDKQIELLNGTWTVTSATFQGNAPTLDQTGMKLTITGSIGNESFNYSVADRPSGPSPWPSSGTFTFGSNVLTELNRDDSEHVSSVSYQVTANQLTMDFTFSGEPYDPSGRTASVSGVWHYEFSKP